MSVNKVILVGNLGRDPESRATQSSTVTNMNIATTERQKDREGNWVDHTEWHRVVCWGKTAENVAKYCRKGRQVYIEGRLQTRKWTGDDGKDRYTTEVVAFDVKFLGSHKDSDQPSGGQSARGGGSGRPSSLARQTAKAAYDEDIPF